MTLDCKIFSSHHALLETVYIIYPKSTINRVESAGILAESVGFWHAVAARGNSIAKHCRLGVYKSVVCPNVLWVGFLACILAFF